MIFSLYRLYIAPSTDIEKKQPVESVAWHELTNAFENDEAAATERFVDQVISVAGTILEIRNSKEGYIIKIGDEGSMVSVICQFDKEDNEMNSQLKAGDSIVIKGICAGYLMDVMLIRCVILEVEE